MGLPPSRAVLARAGMYVAPRFTLPRVVGALAAAAWLRLSPASHNSSMVILASGGLSTPVSAWPHRPLLMVVPTAARKRVLVPVYRTPVMSDWRTHETWSKP